ncbi:MAG: phytoene/squalene synthase family protein [Thermoguttaceae bacterium]
MNENIILQRSIRFCTELTRTSNSSFAPAFALLPEKKREAMHVLYAYTRFTDDLVDKNASLSNRGKMQKLNQWVSAIESVFGQVGGHDATLDPRTESDFQRMAEQFPGCLGIELLPALKMIVEQFQIPREPLFHLVDGVESDINPREFELFEDCADYCHQVATSVGFASLAIWGTTEPLFSNVVVKAAKACGIAFQWTNILRDLVEDFGQGRIYLPQDELSRAGLTVNQFGEMLDQKSWNAQKVWKSSKTKEKNDSFIEQRAHFDRVRTMEQYEKKMRGFLDKQFERCEIYYMSAAPLYQLIQPDARRVFGMMWDRYFTLFRTLKKNPKRMLAGRFSISHIQKLRILLRWRLFPPRRLSL